MTLEVSWKWQMLLLKGLLALLLVTLTSGSDLHVGKHVETFDTLRQAHRYLKNKGGHTFRITTHDRIDYQLVNGRPSARIRHLKKGIAVGDPEKTLSGLGGELPEIRPGSVVAGNLGEFPVLKRIRREVAERQGGAMESNQAVSPANELLIGRLIAQFRTLDDAELTLSPDNFRMTQVVSGHEVSRDVDTGVAVAHPANVLRSLASLPDVVSGRVVAGKPAKLRVLKRLE